MIRELCGAFLSVVFFFCAEHTVAQEDLRVWREFLTLLKSGQMTPEMIQPYKELGDSYKPILLGYLDSVRTQAAPEDWTAVPEVHRVEKRIQYIIPWSSGGEKIPYCFSFVVEGSRWYFQHLEAIFIRLDKVTSLPAAEFPDVSEERKAWVREEIYWSFVVMNIYLPLAKDVGRQYALDRLKDGGGYFVEARAWVPFAPPHKAFVFYLCWEQANLRGNKVTLERLSDTEAVVRVKTHFFSLYSIAAHLKPLISLEDYKGIFSTIWQDRASSAGWKLAIEYSPDSQVTFRFTRRG